ncbi:MAG: hypothetical protein K8R18_09480 [Parvibaculum sp.]|uniref:hypothetical protein n=1 Tax=Parvibaculum sp. TaxID=2024848 RepID=UPI0025F055AE|nr:hypothetical protein [Parvibaculum sp.]MCE9649839.1 hypothetical protein [Parvibaculum sp.]
MRKNQHLITLAFAASLLASPAFAAPQLDKEIAAAAQHAGLAAQGGDIAEVHTHLHHTINCLVGPKGEGFAPKEMNPCSALGNGAIPDAAEGQKKSLKAALVVANKGVAETDFEKAKAGATETQSMLSTIK